MNSSAPHLSSLTVGEWSPKGLGGRLPPVRETDRLKPRQQKMLVTTLAVPQRRAKEPLCLLELNPGRGGEQEKERRVEICEEHREGSRVRQGELSPQVGPRLTQQRTATAAQEKNS